MSIAPHPRAVDTPSWSDKASNPYLRGAFASTVHETTAFDLEVTHGEIPEDLVGAYVRNGPNAVFEPSALYHWFDGDGMVHGVYFRDGKASYRSRFVRTDALAEEVAAERSLWPGIMGPFDFESGRPFL